MSIHSDAELITATAPALGRTMTTIYKKSSIEVKTLQLTASHKHWRKILTLTSQAWWRNQAGTGSPLFINNETDDYDSSRLNTEMFCIGRGENLNKNIPERRSSTNQDIRNERSMQRDAQAIVLFTLSLSVLILLLVYRIDSAVEFLVFLG